MGGDWKAKENDVEGKHHGCCKGSLLIHRLGMPIRLGLIFFYFSQIIVTIAIAVAFSFLYFRLYPGIPPNLVPAFQKIRSSTDARSPFPPSDPTIQSISSKNTCCFYDFETQLPTDPSCPFAEKMCEVPWLADPFPTLANGTFTNSTETAELCNCYHIVQDAAMMHILVNQLTLYVVMLIGGPVFWCMGLVCGG